MESIILKMREIQKTITGEPGLIPEQLTPEQDKTVQKIYEIAEQCESYCMEKISEGKDDE